MINGAHVVVFSTDPESDRIFFRDILKLSSVDAGEGWLIFSLPPSEVAVHPGNKNNIHQLYLTCANINIFVSEMKSKDIKCSEISNETWGQISSLTLPGGGTIGVYQPAHERPKYKE